jgi:predicted small lipoprotein YifL
MGRAPMGARPFLFARRCGKLPGQIREAKRMKRRIGAAILLAAMAALSACGTKQDPNMPTAEENRNLDNAAEMLDSHEASIPNEDAAIGNGDQGTSEDQVGEDAGNAAGNAQ